MKRVSSYFLLSAFLFPFIEAFENRPLITLDDILAYTKSTSEYPQPDNDDPKDPIYRSYYKSKAPTYFGRLLERFHLRTTIYTQFYRNLESMVAFHLKHHLLARYTIALQVKPGTQFLILSNVRGELHSLARILSAWHQNGIIDKHLKLRPDLTFIANGNFLAISPDPVETLEVALRLMQENCPYIFYIRGFFEDKDRWLNHPLGHQLEILFPGDAHVIDLVRSLFNTLPLALYILSDDLHEPPLRLSYYDTIGGEFELLSCRRGQPFTKDYKKAVCFLNRKQAAPQGPLTALIVSNDRGVNFETMKGLQFTPGIPPLWKCLSSPAHPFRHLFGYAYDSFVILTIGKSVKESTLTLFAQNVYKPGFKLEGIYNVVTGKPVTIPGMQPTLRWDRILEALKSFSVSTKPVQKTAKKR